MFSDDKTCLYFVYIVRLRLIADIGRRRLGILGTACHAEATWSSYGRNQDSQVEVPIPTEQLSLSVYKTPFMPGFRDLLQASIYRYYLGRTPRSTEEPREHQL